MTDLADVRERLARIETKIDLLVELEPRVSSLEHWRTFLVGAWGVVVLAVGAVIRMKA